MNHRDLLKVSGKFLLGFCVKFIGNVWIADDSRSLNFCSQYAEKLSSRMKLPCCSAIKNLCDSLSLMPTPIVFVSRFAFRVSRFAPSSPDTYHLSRAWNYNKPEKLCNASRWLKRENHKRKRLDHLIDH
jgi:hypothetical protein